MPEEQAFKIVFFFPWDRRGSDEKCWELRIGKRCQSKLYPEEKCSSLGGARDASGRSSRGQSHSSLQQVCCTSRHGCYHCKPPAIFISSKQMASLPLNRYKMLERSLGLFPTWDRCSEPSPVSCACVGKGVWRDTRNGWGAVAGRLGWSWENSWMGACVNSIKLMGWLQGGVPKPHKSR